MTNYSGDFQRRNWVLAGHFAQNHFWRLMSEEFHRSMGRNAAFGLAAPEYARQVGLGRIDPKQLLNNSRSECSDAASRNNHCTTTSIKPSGRTNSPASLIFGK
jgi:hypothetical protein